jgi:cytidylate kinase
MAVVTISRQYGAGGKTLGEKVSTCLGYYYAVDDIIQRVAWEANVSLEWVECIEKEAGGTLLKFISGPGRKKFSEGLPDYKPGYIDEEIYVHLLHQIIGKIAEEGNAVVLGRGSQYILQEYPEAFHVLLIADTADRVRFMEENYGLSAKDAQAVVNRRDKRRINLYKKFGKQDYDQPHLYHLVLNMSQLSMAKAVDLVCKFAPA